MLGPSKMRFKIEEESATTGKFVLEPLDQGFGHTIGNSLRRVMLSSLEGAAVTQVKIDGVSHQFTTLTGVAEDIVEIILNVKKLRLQMDDNGPYRLQLTATGPGEVTAAQITAPTGVEIMNKDLVIATLANNKTKLSVELVAEKGVGYALAEEHKTNEIGIIPVDSLFSPVVRVNFSVEPTRVGRLTNFDKLVLEVVTDGTMSPQEAVKKSAQILADHFAAVVEPNVAADDEAEQTAAAAPKVSDNMLAMSIEELDLPSRVASRLVEHGVKTVGDVINTPKEELLSMKSFGKKSYDTVIEKLQELGVEV